MTSMQPPVTQFLPSDLVKMAQTAGQDSDRWFGDTEAPLSLGHMALALCGEVGEFANLIKKIDRKSLDIHDSHVRFDLVMEMADIFTYFLCLCDLLHIDPIKAYNAKRGINEARFTKQREEREAKGNE